MLNIRGLEVAYGAGENRVEALKSVNLQISKNEYAAILGPNGSGKSTLIKAVCGLVPFGIGEIKLLKKDVRPGKYGEDLFGKIAVVFQEPTGQFLMPTVEREIGSVLQNLGLSDQEQQERLEHTVDVFSLQSLLPKNPRSLSGGQMQLVNLACALAVNPQLILLDEPTTFLDSHYKNLLLDYIDSLHRSGLTVLHVTQYPDEALRANRVIILDSGQLVADGMPDELLLDGELLAQHRLTMPRSLVCRKWLGFDYDRWKPVSENQPGETLDRRIFATKGKEERTDSFFHVRDLSFSYGKGQFSIQIEKLSLLRNEFVGLVGPAGSGKSTLAFLLAALLKPDSGDIRIDGKPSLEIPINAIRRKVGITWQMPDPAFIGPTVADEIEMIAKNLLPEDVDMDQILSQVGLTGYNDRIVDTLSGGEKRKLSLACILTGDPDYLIFDEPTAFLDPAAQLEMQEIIRGLAGSGKGALIIGHDINFISELADRVIGLGEGRIVFDLPAGEFFSEPAYLRLLGLPDDPLLSFRKRLSENGVRFPFGSLDPKRLAEFMKESGIRWQEFT